MTNVVGTSRPRKDEMIAEDFMMELGNLSLDEIVGQDHAIKELKKLVEAIKYRDIYRSWSFAPPVGILLTGAPGLGKTAAVRALAKELGRSVCLMELRYVDIASKWVDAPIEQLKAFFKVAEQKSKEKHVLIFIDEIDSMIPDRNSQLHETSMKRVNVFLEWMSGGFNSIENITIIGATNFLEGMDAAARRPGRFDKIIQFHDLDIDSIIKGLQIHLQKRNLNHTRLGNIEWDVIRKEIGKTKLSGADLPNIIAQLIESKASEHVEKIAAYKDINKINNAERKSLPFQLDLLPRPITTEDFIKTLQEYIKNKNKIKQNDGTRKAEIGFSV